MKHKIKIKSKTRKYELRDFNLFKSTPIINNTFQFGQQNFFKYNSQKIEMKNLKLRYNIEIKRKYFFSFYHS